MTTPKLVFIDCSLIDSTSGASSGQVYDYSSYYDTTSSSDPGTYVKNFFKNVVQSELSGIPTEIWNNRITSVSDEQSCFKYQGASIAGDATGKLRDFVNKINALPDNSSVWMNMYGRTRPNIYQDTVTYPDSNPNSILIDFCSDSGSGSGSGSDIIINSEIFRKVLQYIKPSIRIFISIDAFFGASLGLLKFMYNGTNTLEPYIHNPNAGFPRVYADVIILASSSIYDYMNLPPNTQYTTNSSAYHTNYRNYYDPIPNPEEKESKFNKYLFTDTSDLSTPNTYYTADGGKDIPFFTYALVQSFNYLLVTTKRVPTVFNLYFEILNFYNSYKSTEASFTSDVRYYINYSTTITNTKLKAYPVIVSERAVDLNKYVLDIYNSDSTVNIPSEGMILPSVIHLVPNSYKDNDPKKTLISSIDLDNLSAIRAVPYENSPSEDEKAFVKDDRLLFRFVVYYDFIYDSSLSGFKSSLTTNWTFEDSLFNELVEDYNNLFDPDPYIDIGTTISGTTLENLQNMCYSSMKELYDTLNKLKPGHDMWWRNTDAVKQMKSLKLYKLTVLSAIESVTGLQFFQFDQTVPVLSTDKTWLKTDYAKQPFIVDPSTSMFTLIRKNQQDTNYTIEDAKFNLNANLNEIMLNSNNIFDVENRLITTITDIQITLDGAPYTALNVVESYPALNTYILPTDKIPQYNSGIKSLGWTVCDLNTYEDNIYYNYLFKISLDTSEYINKKIIKELYLDCDLYPPKGAAFPLELVSLIDHTNSPYSDTSTCADVLYFHNAGSNTFLSNNFYFSNINNGNYISSSNTDLFLMALEHPVSNQFSPIQNSTADFRVTVTNMSNVFFDLDTQTEYFQKNLNFNIHMIGRISNDFDEVYATYIQNIENMIEVAKYSTTKYLDPEKIDNIDFSKHLLQFHDKIIDEADLYFDQQKIPFENFDSAQEHHGSIEVSENVISSARFDVATVTALSSESTEFNTSIAIRGNYYNLFDKLRSYFNTYSTASLYDEADTTLINLHNEVLFSNCSATVHLQNKLESITSGSSPPMSKLSDSYADVYIKSLAVQKLLSICSGAETRTLSGNFKTFIDDLQTYIQLVNQEIDRIAPPFNLYKNLTSTQNEFVTNTILVKALDIYVNELTNSVEVDNPVSVDIKTYNGTQSITDTNAKITMRYTEIKYFLGKADAANTVVNLGRATNANHIDQDVINGFNDGRTILSHVNSFDSSNFLESYKGIGVMSSTVQNFEVIKYHHRLTVPADMDTSNNNLINTINSSNLFAQYTIRSMGLNKSNLINFYTNYKTYASNLNQVAIDYSNVSDAITVFNPLSYPPSSESNQYFSNDYSNANSNIDAINSNIDTYTTTNNSNVDNLVFSDSNDKTTYLRNQLKMMYHIHSNSNIQNNLNKISMVIWQYNVYMDAYTQLSNNISNISNISGFRFTTQANYSSTLTGSNLGEYFTSFATTVAFSNVQSNYNNLCDYFSNIENAMNPSTSNSIMYHFSSNNKYFATNEIRSSLSNVYDNSNAYNSATDVTIYSNLSNYKTAINAATTLTESTSNWQSYKTTFESILLQIADTHSNASNYATNAINYYARTSNQYASFKTQMSNIYSNLSNDYSNTYDTAYSNTSSANNAVTAITGLEPSVPTAPTVIVPTVPTDPVEDSNERTYRSNLNSYRSNLNTYSNNLLIGYQTATLDVPPERVIFTYNPDPPQSDQVVNRSNLEGYLSNLNNYSNSLTTSNIGTYLSNLTTYYRPNYLRYVALNDLSVPFSNVTTETSNVNDAYSNYTTGTGSNDNSNMSNQLSNLISAQSNYITVLTGKQGDYADASNLLENIKFVFVTASNANVHAKNVFGALNITNAIRHKNGINYGNGVDSTSITIDDSNMQSNLSNLSTALYTLDTIPSNPYSNAQGAIVIIGYSNGTEQTNKLPHFYDFGTAETDYKNALIAIGKWATNFTVSFNINGADRNINLTNINNFQTKMHAHLSNSSNINTNINTDITTSGGAITLLDTPFNNYNYNSTDSTTMNSQIRRIQSLFTTLFGSYSNYQMLVESSSSNLYNYLSNNATSRTHIISSTEITGDIGNIYIKFDFFNNSNTILSSTYHAYYTYTDGATTVNNYQRLTDTALNNPFDTDDATKNAPALLSQLDAVYQQMEMIKTVAKWARLSQTVQVMQKICSTNNPTVPTDFTANSASSLPTETSKYILSVFDLPATSLKPPIKDFDLRLEFSNDISFYPLSNLFETPMNTFSDLYSVKSNDCLFMSWTNDRKLFPICSNEYKSPLYSNMLLNIPFTKNIPGTLLSINTGLKINDAAVATKSVAVSNLNLMSTNNELTTYLNGLRMESGFVDTNMSNTQQFQFKADVNFKKNDGTNTDIYEPISNITPDSFKFPYYKCYTIPTNDANLNIDDLEITFRGNDKIVFNSNSDMFWYNADLYKSLLVLTETSNNLSFKARGSTYFTKNEKSNLFYVAGIPQGGGTIESVFDVESCTQTSYLHMEQTLVTMCNLRYFNSNHSRVPPWTAHDVFLYMSREGFSNIIFNNSFDLNTDLYDDPTTEENLQNYQIMPFGANDNSSNLYMWYSNSAGNNLNLSFELSNSGSKTYNNYDGCKFYDMRSTPPTSSPKVNHIAIATNDTNKVRVNMNVDYDDTTSDLSNVFLHLNYPNTGVGVEYFNNDQYIYVFENSNNSIYVNIDSNTSDGNSKITSLDPYGIVDPTPITLNFDSVYRLTHAASTPFEYNPSFNQTDTIDLNYTHTSKIFRAYGFKISVASSKFFEIQFELTNTRPGRNLKFSTKPVRNYQNYHQVDQRVEVQETKDILFTRFYRPDSIIGDLYFSICIETTVIPIEKNYLRMGTLTYNAHSSITYNGFLESDTFPYATDLY
jgi:hypothetical protein